MKNSIIFTLFIATFFFGFPSKSIACPFAGGEITWECIPYSDLDTNSGKFIFTLKLYRECGSQTFTANQLIYSNSPYSIISVHEITGWPKDISPICNSNNNFQHISCSGAAFPSNFTGAIEEHIFRSQPVKINGYPPSNGWVFYWGGCCRNPANNLYGTAQSYKLRAVMYPKLITGAPNNATQNTYPCFDSSPTFAESPESAIATAYDYSINYHANDPDRDSIVYEWGQALESNGDTVLMFNPYTYNSPFPGTTQNTNNIPATLDSTTGLINFKSYTTGAFLNCVKVTSYRNGVKLSEIWRDFTVALLDSSNNAPPVISPIFLNNTSFDTVVVAGSLIQFNFISTDFQYLPNSSPQTIFATQSSPQFGSFIPASGTGSTSLSAITGCNTPPCATLSPASDTNFTPFGVFGYQSNFSWQTDCAHLIGSDSSIIQKDTVYYKFLFTVKDDYCPVPAVTNKIITIGVTADLSFLTSPIIDSVFFDYSANDVHISWQAVSDPNNKFLAYYIYYSKSYNGTYSLIDSLMNVNSTSYTHSLGQSTSAYYKIRTLSINNCSQIDTSDFSAVLSLNITSIKNRHSHDSFIIYPNEPNPAKTFTNIKFYTEKAVEVKLVLVDLSGKIVLSKTIQSISGLNTFKLSLQNLCSGIYYYSILYKNQKKTRKLIVK